MITNKNEAKLMTEHISFDCKCKFNSTVRNSNQKWNSKSYQGECKSYCTCKKDYSWNSSICIFENSKYLIVMKLFLLWILYQQKRQMLRVLRQ